jgi:hypothetical protein
MSSINWWSPYVSVREERNYLVERKGMDRIVREWNQESLSSEGVPEPWRVSGVDGDRKAR